jgi:hypothetical protein
MSLGTGPVPPREDRDYDAFLDALHAAFDRASGPLFTTDATGADLWDAYLSSLPAEDQQHYNCNACRRFIETYGGLVTIDAAGRTTSVMWDGEVPSPIGRSLAALRRHVAAARVTGVFLTSASTWGVPAAGGWRHMHVHPANARLFKATGLRNAEQAAAEKREEYGMLQRALADFPADLAGQAHQLCLSEALYRSEKVLGVIEWFWKLHVARQGVRGRAAENLTWLAVATAPQGFCHVRSTMIGTLLEDLAAGLPFEDVKRRFGAKMNPLQYQRPTAPPSAGNIAQAEKIVAELRSAGALARRFARLDDVQERLWTPAPTRPAPPRDQGGGVFGHLLPQPTVPDVAPAVAGMPPQVMTWEKFSRTILPRAETIEFLVPTGMGPYYALVTAVDPAAPPILQWDREDQRNPVSWYTYPSGSMAPNWNLRAGTFHPVTAVTAFPFMWNGGVYPHQGDGVLFLLKDAIDKGYREGAGLFPELLKGEYHAVRATMEAFARQAVIADRDTAECCGVGIRKGDRGFGFGLGVTLRVTSNGVRSTYKLDRWD